MDIESKCALFHAEPRCWLLFICIHKVELASAGSTQADILFSSSIKRYLRDKVLVSATAAVSAESPEIQGRPHKRGPKQLLLLTLRFGASPSTLFSVHQCTRTASSLGLATGSCFCLWSSFRLRFWSHRQLQDTA